MTQPHVLVTGGAGFIGSMFVRVALDAGYKVSILDALTYAGDISNIADILGDTCHFIEGSICDAALLDTLLSEQSAPITHIADFAAESHVDNSIANPDSFIHTNIIGTYTMLQAVRRALSARPTLRYVHVSTDEVYGTLGDDGHFTEASAYLPNSPYSASKAAGDMLCRAWFHTYGLPVIVTNCSNNYGPRQHPEKLIPRMISLALAGHNLPIYGSGHNVRDWIHVRDHARGILLALEHGIVGETYCFGGRAERRNIDIVTQICSLLDTLAPADAPYARLITHVQDRAGHDWRYAIDDSKAERALGFTREYNFNAGLEATVQWYLANHGWVTHIQRKAA